MEKIVLEYPLILASGSPRRRELLAEMGFDYRIVTADCEELSASSGLPGTVLAEKNAFAKAEAVSGQYPASLVLGADTVVICEDRIYGKPASEEEAFAMLQSLSGRKHQVVTGVALLCPEGAVCENFSVTTEVFFKKMSEGTIREYMKLVPVMDKAGAYAIQDHGEMLLEKMEGSFSNVIGLPCERVKELLEKFRK